MAEPREEGKLGIMPDEAEKEASQWSDFSAHRAMLKSLGFLPRTFVHIIAWLVYNASKVFGILNPFG